MMWSVHRVFFFSLFLTRIVFPLNPERKCMSFSDIDNDKYRACKCIVYLHDGGPEGLFQSPDFPTPYEDSINCLLYTFVGDVSEAIELHFTEFDLQPRSPVTQECGDFVRLYLHLERPELNERTPFDEELCGSNRTVATTWFSSERSLSFEFHSDNTTTRHLGFRGKFRFRQREEFETDGRRDFDTYCDHYFSSSAKKRGKFYSPLFPRPYRKSITCRYIFHAGSREVVEIRFDGVYLPSADDDGCVTAGNVITVYDGPSESSPVVQRLCGQKRNLGPFKLRSAETLVIFQTDETVNKQGFEASFSFVERSSTTESHATSIHTTDDHGRPGHGSTVPLVTIPDTTTPTTQPSVIDCDKTYRSDESRNGTFESPFYPRQYPRGTRCTYKFVGEKEEQVQIIFLQFDLHYPHGALDSKETPDCRDVDTVVPSYYINGKLTEIDHGFCGNRNPPSVMSNDNWMQLVFKGDRTNEQAKGFRALYRFVRHFGITNGLPLSTEQCTIEMRSGVNSNGTIMAPNFPGLYPRTSTCNYLFYGKPGEVVRISFLYFDVEGVYPCSDDTQSDYVEFSNFRIRDRKFQRYCGRNKPTEVISDGVFFRLTFQTNDVYDATGFEAYYQFRTPHDPMMPDQRDRSQAAIPEFLPCLVLTSLVGWLLRSALN